MNEQLIKEIWGGHFSNVLRDLRDTHLADIPDKSKEVKLGAGFSSGILILTESGGDAKILVDNTTYPIGTKQRKDRPHSFNLRKIETENQAISDDEVFGLPYDKERDVTLQQEESLKENKIAIMTHGLAPAGHKETTPLFPTTGKNDTGNVFKKLSLGDIEKLALYCDENNFPADRILLMTPKHVYDLYQAKEILPEEYRAIVSGEIVELYGFSVRKYTKMPFYKGATVANSKLEAFGTVYNGGVGVSSARHRHASILYCPSKMIKASTIVKMYYTPAESNPSMRQSEMGLRTYALASPRVPQEKDALAGTHHCIAALVAADA